MRARAISLGIAIEADVGSTLHSSDQGPADQQPQLQANRNARPPIPHSTEFSSGALAAFVGQGWQQPLNRLSPARPMGCTGQLKATAG
jgi:hypothetical protein